MPSLLVPSLSVSDDDLVLCGQVEQRIPASQSTLIYSMFIFLWLKDQPEPVFLNVYGAQELIPRNEFRQSM
jgi:hypothetical protein